MDLVDDRRVLAQAVRQPLRELEAQVEPVRTNVEEQVARGRRRPVPVAGQRLERMQLGRTRRPDQPVPDLGPDPDHARERALREA